MGDRKESERVKEMRVKGWKRCGRRATERRIEGWKRWGYKGGGIICCYEPWLIAAYEVTTAWNENGDVITALKGNITQRNGYITRTPTSMFQLSDVFCVCHTCMVSLFDVAYCDLTVTTFSLWCVWCSRTLNLQSMCVPSYIVRNQLYNHRMYDITTVTKHCTSILSTLMLAISSISSQ